MAFSIFTLGVASIIVGKTQRDRRDAYNYYCVMVKLPTVYTTQLNKHIFDMTNRG